MRLPIPEAIVGAAELGHVHFIGLGGAGLSAIARLMVGQGITVSGSDQNDSALLHALGAEGISCFVGHEATHLEGVDTVIASTAVHADNPEIIEAQRRGIRLWPRSAGLQSVLMGKRTIAVAGTHGKTTTTAMLTMALRAAGADPSFAIGAEVADLGTNARVGSGDLFVAEADESDGAFLVYTPAGAIVTNVDADHLDNYGTVEAYEEAFVQFLGHVSEFLVLCADDPGVQRLLAAAVDTSALGPVVMTVGFDCEARLRGSGLVIDGDHTAFNVALDGEPLGRVMLLVPGQHYALDALLAVGAGLSAGYDFEPLAAGLAKFSGAKRRMESLGAAAGIRVYDSYAHHPTEIRGDLAAARAIAGGDRLVVAFQPHLVSRTRIFGAAMGRELSAADQVIVADIYLAREEPDELVTPQLILGAVEGASAVAGGPIDGLVATLLAIVQPGDVLLTLGAGDITTVGPRVLKTLRARESR